MKRFGMLLILLVLSLSAAAQQKTLFGPGKITVGGYFSPVVRYSSVNDKSAVLVGGRGGIILNHVLSIGFGGYGLVNNIDAEFRGPFGERYMEFGYGGLDLEYVFKPQELVHLSIHTLIGAGGVVHSSRNWGDDFDFNRETGDAFFVFEPGVNVDLNVTTFFRLSLGGTYRFVSGVNHGTTTNEGLSGASAMLSFRFGKF